MNLQPLIDQFRSVMGSADPRLQELQAAAAQINAATNQAAWEVGVKRFQTVALGIVTSYVEESLPEGIPGRDELLDQLRQGIVGLSDGLRKPLIFGPLTLDVDLPLVKDRFEPAGGEPVVLPLALMPPTGFGVGVDAGAARGGGRFSIQRRPTSRLTGSFGLKLGVVDVSSFAILEDAGVPSSVLLLTARFTPGIQLGFGFALGGVGGLIGVNRLLDLDAIRARFVSGEAVNALFPDDAVKNAPAVLATLGAIFPPREGSHLFGPALQITWLKIGKLPLFQLDLCVFAELPGFARIALIGSARAEIPVALHLRMDVLGEIDGPKETLTFGAALVDSYVVGVFRIGGTAAFQMCFGDRPYAVLTIGGFYPGFNPEPAVLPPQQRVNLAVDSPLPGLYLRAEGYFAVTPNNVQFGGRLETGIGTEDFGARGFLMLDAFVQFSPFYFESRFAAGFAIVAFGEELGVNVSGTISGPGPLVINASLSFEVLIFEISWSDTFAIGDPRPLDPPPPPLLDALLGEVRPENLRIQNADDRWVERRLDAAIPTLLAPLGSLVWSQRRSPLSIVVEKLDGAPLPSPQGIVASATGSTGVARERFSPGQFRNLSDSEKLNQATFDLLDSGTMIGFTVESANGVVGNLEFDQYFRRAPDDPSTGSFQLFQLAVLDALDGRLAAATIMDTEPIVGVKDEMWTVQSGALRHDFTTETGAHIAARHERAVALPTLDIVSVGAEI
jgi:hypothetical protein